MFTRSLMVFLLTALLLAGQGAVAGELLNALHRAAPQLEPRALQGALQALRCAEREGVGEGRRLAVIDYSRSSLARRLWVFDLTHGRLLQREFVAHGRQSGELFAEHFSNQPGSNQSSLGLFRGAESYKGRHGHSLRLDGLEPGLNDQARARALVIHGADYVAPTWAQKYGRMGRSLGCPAVQQEVIGVLVDQLKDGQYLFTWHPQISDERYRDCASVSVARSVE
ncbi:murein L,D-transpeptidase catalytic domain family protein [uncultured Pseudomonas sp.]|uniref:murein L,D-transpeptidase catalytic domain family protein n=1 Tax=uncultured Pseudomonas sp. TaxID=114707 RepID=UPI0025E3482F|nr:murein L,D-transpeptidase catalytic domain family protein [uncultured Pseudomonas sp.]MCW1938756.1 murein L,D-transpeptidase catalytic domain family protein [Pseudomonas sp. MDMC_285]